MSLRDMSLRTGLLVGGLTLYGTSMAMMITGGLGLNPWDVFHQGLGTRLPISFGAITAVTGVVVLLLWIPLRQRPGVGTVANIVVIAVSVDLALGWLPDPTSLVSRATFLTGGIVLNGVATAAYISAGLGPGPRDGLMTGLVARTRLSVRLVRTGIELAVLGTGWLLGGTVGAGTVLYALAIGPLVHVFLGVMPQKFSTPKFTTPKSTARADGNHSSVESSVPAERIPTETP